MADWPRRPAQPDGATLTPADLPPGLAGLPRHRPTQSELDRLELLLSGALEPVTALMSREEIAAVRSRGRLADGTPWKVPVSLTVPEVPTTDRIVLVDDEASPLALLTVTEQWPDGDAIRVAGPVRRLRRPEHGAFRALRRDPAEVTSELGGPALGYIPARPPTTAELADLTAAAQQGGVPLLLLPILRGGRSWPGPVVVSSWLAAAADLPPTTVIVPLAEQELAAQAAHGFGATRLAVPASSPQRMHRTVGPLDVVPIPDRRPERDALRAALEAGDDIPADLTPPAVGRVLRLHRPPKHQRGVTVFFTGLSGSGKSTVARAVADALTERADRRFSLLDGDVVRTMLSAGLGFSRADRDRNILRIGYVAAEITRHGGLAICAPIAPYAATRVEVRRMVAEAGDFVLVHVSTPLEVCEARDRKGLYAKARAGLIPEFTGISDPYEAPSDADLVLDTSAMTTDEAVRRVLSLLVDGGWLAAASDPAG